MGPGDRDAAVADANRAQSESWLKASNGTDEANLGETCLSPQFTKSLGTLTVRTLHTSSRDHSNRLRWHRGNSASAELPLIRPTGVPPAHIVPYHLRPIDPAPGMGFRKSPIEFAASRGAPAMGRQPLDAPPATALPKDMALHAKVSVQTLTPERLPDPLPPGETVPPGETADKADDSENIATQANTTGSATLAQLPSLQHRRQEPKEAWEALFRPSVGLWQTTFSPRVSQILQGGCCQSTLTQSQQTHYPTHTNRGFPLKTTTI